MKIGTLGRNIRSVIMGVPIILMSAFVTVYQSNLYVSFHLNVSVVCLYKTQGQGLDKAMTASEAQAFVGDQPCVVTVLHDDKLFLEAPSTPPKAHARRQRRDTSSETMDLVVSSGSHSGVHGVTVFFRPLSQLFVFLFLISPLRLSLVMDSGMSAPCATRRRATFRYTSSSQP